MIEVKLNSGDVFRIKWIQQDKHAVFPVVSTIACVEICPTFGAVGSASATAKACRSPLDEFDAVRGKKLAIGRAMRALPIGRSARTEIWESLRMLLA